MLSVDQIAGYSDPFRGYLMDEIEEEWEVTLPILIRKGYLIRNDTKGTYEVDGALALCIEVCGSNYAVRATKHIDGLGDYEGFLFFTPELAVEWTDDGHGNMFICPVANAPLSIDVLYGLFPLNMSSEKKWIIELSQVTWREWIVYSSEQMMNALLEEGCLPEAAEVICHCFLHAESSGSMEYWTRTGSYWNQESYHFVRIGDLAYLVSDTNMSSIRIQAFEPSIVKASLECFADLFKVVKEGARS